MTFLSCYASSPTSFIVTSADGVTWTTQAGTTPFAITHVAKKGSRYVGSYVTRSGGAHACYTDSLSSNWIDVNVPAQVGVIAAQGPPTTDGTFFYIGGTYHLYRSPDATSWSVLLDGATPIAPPSGAAAFGWKLLFNGTKYLAVTHGFDYFSGPFKLFTTPDITTNAGWVDVTPSPSSQNQHGDVTFTGGIYVLSCLQPVDPPDLNHGGILRFYTSTDLSTWTPVVLPVAIEGVHFTNGQLLYQNGVWLLTASVGASPFQSTFYTWTAPDTGFAWTLIASQTSTLSGTGKGVFQDAALADSFSGNGPKMIATVVTYSSGVALPDGECISAAGATWVELANGNTVYP